MSNEFDAAVAASLQPDQSQAARVGFSVATDTNPDAYAEAQRVARRTGVPVDTVLTMPKEMKRQDAMGTIDFDALAKTSPATASLLADVERAKIAHDDVENMGVIETLVNSFRRGIPALKSILPSITMVNQAAGLDMYRKIDERIAAGEDPKKVLADYGDYGLAPLPWQTSEQALAGWNSWKAKAVPKMQGDIGEAATDVARLQAERAAIPLPGVVDRTMAAKTWGDAFSEIASDPVRFVAAIGPESLMQSAPGLVAAIPAGFAAGPGGSAATIGANSFIVDYASTLTEAMQSAGIDTSDPEAIRAALKNPEILTKITDQAVKHASVVGAFDALSGGIAGKMVLPKRVAGKLASRPLAQEMANIAAQVPIQGALGGLGELGGEINAGQEIQPGNVLAEVFGEFFGTPAEVVSASAKRIHERIGQVRQAEQDAQTISNLNELAKASKVLQRDPQTFEQFVTQAAEGGPVQQVFIDANTLMQSGVAEQVAAVSPAVATQLAEAVQTGGQIAIPVGEYTARIAPTEYAQSLLDHLKTDPEGFSRAEAQQYMEHHAEELRAEVERTLTEKMGDDTFKQSAEAVRAEVKAQLDAAARFTPQVNDAYSSMVGNFYAVQAARLGITPEEMFKRYPLKVGAERIDGPQFDQAHGPFGPVLSNYKGNAQGAIAKLMEMKSGEAIGALHHPDIGDIDLVWGEEGTGASDGYGVAKLAKYHPEVLNDLQGILSAMKVTTRNKNRVNLESADHRAAVRLTWDDQAKHWLLTAFQKKEGGATSTTTDTAGLNGEGDTARLSDASDSIVDQKLDQFYQDKNGPRGSFNPATMSISLLKNADLSTFLHESGHFFLEVMADMADMAARQDALAQVQQDIAALLQWFGVKDLNEWHGLDFEEKRAYHEKFARGFEAYLFEGKAPSIEMQGLFQRFRAWLLNVYRDLKNLNVELTDEVRGVFDRMLASSEQITLAEQGRSMMPLFTSPEQAGMTPDEFAAYQALGVDATNEAIQDLQARGLRDMQWLHNARDRVIKQLQKAAKAQRAEAQIEVRREVMSEPIYQAWQYLTGKEIEGGEPVGKLSRTALAEMYGGHDGGKADKYALLDWKRLTDLRMTAEEGEHPDMVAERFGFSSGDELVRKLLAAEKPDVEIEALTDVRMLEQYGELSSPEAIEKAADRAIHNDARARFVATEANALAKATGQRKVLTSAAKEYASAMIARLKVRDIKPGQYASAEVRAAKAAEKASKSGDLATAAAEKRNQLIQNYATRAAYDAQDTVDKGLRYLKKFEGDIKGLDADYAEQIGNLLERFDLRKGQSNKAVDKRTALAEWIKAQREAGLEPDIPAALENEAFRTSYKNLTVEDFRGLVDSVRQIEHLGRLKHKLLTAADQRAYEAVRDEIAASIHEHAQGREADTRTPTTNTGRAVQGLKRFWAAHIKAATWARVMDGGKDGGPMWEYFVRNANERGDMETTMRAEATSKLSEILAPVFKLGKMGGKGQFFPSIGRSLNREARLAIAMNMGNEGNTQRLLGGEGWTIQQITPVLQSLTAQEWQAVQAVWDHFESYRPQIAAKERRVYGKEPEWVEPRPFAVTTADGTTVQMRGGYYPIKYDPAASQRAEEHADAEGAKRQLQGAYTTATTRRSFTKSRAEEVSGRPLLYTMAGLYSGVNDVIHDLAWHEWLVDTNRLLRSHTIDQAIREHYGPEAKQQFKTWAQDIAEGEKGADAAVDLALSRLRQGISASGLGFNVMSAIMQPLGITQSITRVGAQWVGRGVLKYLGGPIDLTRQVNEMSDFMANRARTRFRELNELRNQVQDQSAFKEMTGRYAYFLMMRCQQMVDVPTWWGAYEKAIAEGNEESRAVSLADQAVIDAQGGGQTKDLSAIERGGPAQKLFTVFYSFMNTALNIGVEKTMSADTPAKRAKLAVDYAMLYVVPAVLGYFLKAALTPGDAGDDDPEKLAKKLAANQIDYLMGLMVVVREFAEAGKTLTGANDLGRDYTGPAGLRVVSDTVSMAKQAHQGEFDDAFRKAAVNLVGDLAGLPSAQINRTVTGIKAIKEGKTSNPAAVVFGFQEKR